MSKSSAHIATTLKSSLLALLALALFAPATAPDALASQAVTSAAAKAIAKAPGTIKIPSNAHSADASSLGITVTWNPKQKDNVLVSLAPMPDGSHVTFDVLVQSSGNYSLVRVENTGVLEILKPGKNINMLHITNIQEPGAITNTDPGKQAAFTRYETLAMIWRAAVDNPDTSTDVLMALWLEYGLEHYYQVYEFYLVWPPPPFFSYEDGTEELFNYWADHLERILLAAGVIDAPIVVP